MEELTTTSEIMNVLGGNAAVATLTGSKPKAVSNWRGFNSFPANTYLVLIEALHQQGKTAPTSLWGMKSPAETETAS